MNLNAQQTIMLQALAAKELALKLPLNDYGLPIGYYRVDMLPLDKFKHKDTLNSNSNPNLLIDGSTNNGSYAHGTLGTPEPEPQPVLIDLETGTSSHDGTMSKELIEQYEEGRRVMMEHRAHVSPELVIVTDAPSFDFTRADLNVAWVPLSYLEGFPTLPSGQPFWSILPHEPGELHLALEAYLQLPTLHSQGIRQLSQLPEFLAQLRSTTYLRHRTLGTPNVLLRVLLAVSSQSLRPLQDRVVAT
jgi:hypothetical protein